MITNDETMEYVLGNWVKRPCRAIELVGKCKTENGKLTPELKQELQLWYNGNRGTMFLMT